MKTPRVIILDGKRGRNKNQLRRVIERLIKGNGFQVEVFKAEDLIEHEKFEYDYITNAVLALPDITRRMLKEVFIRGGVKEDLLKPSYQKHFKQDRKKFVIIDREVVDGFIVKNKETLKIPMYGTLKPEEAQELETLVQLGKTLLLNVTTLKVEGELSRASFLTEHVIRQVTEGDVFEHYDNPRSALLEVDLGFVISQNRFVTLTIG